MPLMNTPMAFNSIAASGIGLGFGIVDKREPDYTIRASAHRVQVCRRKTESWKEIIAEFSSKDHAEIFLRALLLR